MNATLAIAPQRDALFLDLDGTLVEIAPRPEAVRLKEGMASLFSRLHQCFGGAFAIVSGRPIDAVDAILMPACLPVAGLHGLEVRPAATGAVERAAPLSSIAVLRERLDAAGLADGGVFVEDKGQALAVHYRAAPGREAEVLQTMRRLTADLADLSLLEGKMVVEAKPKAVDKGTVVRSLMAHAPFAGRRPVFIGDDVTDEDAILAVQALGGIGAKVGPGTSAARARLPDVAAVHALLTRLAQGCATTASS